jgi:Tfp pilus assembly protein PilN
MQTINLLPQGYAQTERSKRRLLISGAVVVAAFLAMFGVGRLMSQRIELKRRGTAQREGRQGDLKIARAELAAHNQTLQRLARKYALIETVSRNRRWASYLAHLAAATNEDIVLTRAHISPVQGDANPAATKRRGALTAPAPGANLPVKEVDKTRPKKLVLLLEGYAASNTDITRFIAALSSHDIFEKVTFKGSQTAQINAKPLSKFELECPIRYAPRRRATPVPNVQPAQGPADADQPTLLSKSTAPSEGGRQ